MRWSTLSQSHWVDVASWTISHWKRMKCSVASCRWWWRFVRRLRQQISTAWLTWISIAGSRRARLFRCGGYYIASTNRKLQEQKMKSFLLASDTGHRYVSDTLLNEFPFNWETSREWEGEREGGRKWVFLQCRRRTIMTAVRHCSLANFNFNFSGWQCGVQKWRTASAMGTWPPKPNTQRN